MSDPGAPKPKLKLNKWWLIGGGLAVAFVVYEYRKRAASSSTAAQASTNTAIDPATGVPYANEVAGSSSIDPTTGIPYADETGDYGTTYGSPYSALGGLSYNAATGQYQAASTSALPAALSSNGSWAQQVSNYLESSGYNPASVTDAIGAYLSGNGQGLTQQQYSIVQTALGYFGSPPTGVPAPVLANNAGQSVTSSINAWLNPPAGTEYTQNTVTGEIDQLLPSGIVTHLTPQQYAALGRPSYTPFTGGTTVTPYAPGQLGAGPGLAGYTAIAANKTPVNASAA